MMMSAQLVSIIVMFMSGIAVGAVIDAIRNFLQVVGIRKMVFLLEWIVWIFLGACTFYFLFLVKGGEWRVVDPLAQITGIVAYDVMFQKFFRLMGRFLVNSIIKPFFFIGHVVVHIIRKMIVILVKVIKGIFYPIYRLVYNIMAKIFQKRK